MIYVVFWYKNLDFGLDLNWTWVNQNPCLSWKSETTQTAFELILWTWSWNLVGNESCFFSYQEMLNTWPSSLLCNLGLMASWLFGFVDVGNGTKNTRISWHSSHFTFTLEKPVGISNGRNICSKNVKYCWNYFYC